MFSVVSCANRAVSSNRDVLLGSNSKFSRAAVRAAAVSPMPSRANALRKPAFIELESYSKDSLQS